MFTTYDYEEAERFAKEHSMLIIEHIYEWADSEPVAEYRGGHYSEHWAVTGIIWGDEPELEPGETCAECGYEEEGEAHETR
jgi:hypothetical protein